MQHHHQRFRRLCCGGINAPTRTIQIGQQLTRFGGTTRQGRNWNANGLPLINRQVHRPERVPQGLQVATEPGKALLKQLNPQLLQQLGIVSAQWHHFLPSPRSLSSVSRSPSTFLASPNTIDVFASSNRSFLMPE